MYEVKYHHVPNSNNCYVDLWEGGKLIWWLDFRSGDILHNSCRESPASLRDGKCRKCGESLSAFWQQALRLGIG